ncbi:MAG TPA: ECF transporter S component [Mobilitalea sp.]|nr:ECF transporter S component [Mobilitalea sp.]
MLQVSLLLAIGMILPFFTAQVPSVGSKLLPMHIPVLLAGIICGWQYGLFIGFVLPLLRSTIFGMPPLFPIAIAMAFEMAMYGAVIGILYRIFPKKSIYIYISLIISMIAGRIVWGSVSMFLFGLNGSTFTWKLFVAGALVNALPGILIQIIIIPILVVALKKVNLIEN